MGPWKNSCKSGRVVFVISPQTRATLGESAYWYGETVSGQTIYSYVEGNPVWLVEPAGLRDIIIAIWSAKIKGKETSVGHVWMGELNGATITSQFPEVHGALGFNQTLTWLNTVRAEDRPADYVYQISIKNDAAFNDMAAQSRDATIWIALPYYGTTTTNCVNGANNALRAGGLSTPRYPVLPDILNADLLLKSLSRSNVTRLPLSPW
jgi:hypothetical protein